MMENAFHPDAYIFKEGKINLNYTLSVCLNVCILFFKSFMIIKCKHYGGNQMSISKDKFCKFNVIIR